MSFARSLTSLLAGAALCASASAIAITSAHAQDKKPNIVFIMGDDIGWMQPSIYHEGLMVGETPNIDRIAERANVAKSFQDPPRTTRFAARGALPSIQADPSGGAPL